MVTETFKVSLGFVPHVVGLHQRYGHSTESRTHILCLAVHVPFYSAADEGHIRSRIKTRY